MKSQQIYEDSLCDFVKTSVLHQPEWVVKVVIKYWRERENYLVIVTLQLGYLVCDSVQKHQQVAE